MKFLRRYNNKDKSSFTMTVKMELTDTNVDCYLVLFYPECQNGGKEKINEILVSKKRWKIWGDVSVRKKLRTVIYKANVKKELADIILFVDAYWKTLNLWTQGDPEQDIQLPVGHFLFLVNKLSWALGNNMIPSGDDIISFLEKHGFVESKNLGMW